MPVECKNNKKEMADNKLTHPTEHECVRITLKAMRILHDVANNVTHKMTGELIKEIVNDATIKEKFVELDWKIKIVELMKAIWRTENGVGDDDGDGEDDNKDGIDEKKMKTHKDVQAVIQATNVMGTLSRLRAECIGESLMRINEILDYWDKADDLNRVKAEHKTKCDRQASAYHALKRDVTIADEQHAFRCSKKAKK
jgi:hypothetical protein